MTAFYSVVNGTTAHTDGFIRVRGDIRPVYEANPNIRDLVVIDTGICTGSPAEPFTKAYVFQLISSGADIVYNPGINTSDVYVFVDGSPSGIPAPQGEYVTAAVGTYVLNYTDGTKDPLIVPPADVVTPSAGMGLPGRATLNYGSIINQSLLHVLENFAGPSDPGGNEGQLWYDTSTKANKVLKVYDGTSWIPVSGAQSVYWRDPARIIVQSNFATVADAEAWLNANPQPQGIATPLVDGDRILFQDINTGGSPAVDNSNVYTVVGQPGGSPEQATLLVDQNRFPPEPLRGDAVYIIEGNEPHTIYFFDENDQWRQFSGGSGGGLGLTYEAQLAGGGDTFTLSNPYVPTADGSGLLVFVNGIKQVPNESYIEVDAVTVQFIGSPIAATAGKVVEFYPIAPTTDNAVGVREVHDATTGSTFTAAGSPLGEPGSPPGIKFTFDTISYVPGTESLLVFLNGQKAVRGRDYDEFDASSIIWTGAEVDTSADDRMEFYAYVPIVAGTRLGDIYDVDPSVSYGSFPSPQVGDALVWDGNWWTYDSASGKVYDEINITGSPTTLGSPRDVVPLTNVTAVAKTSTRSFIQVFVNGILQKEGTGSPGSGNFHVTGEKELTFEPGVLPADADIVVYQL